MASERDIEVVRDFLTEPASLRHQSRFWEVCVPIALGYIRTHSALSLPFPVADIDPSKTNADLATSCLSYLLEPVDRRLYAKVFDFFRRRKITDFSRTDPRELYYQLTVLVRGHIRREIYKQIRREDPNFSNIEKGFKNVLAADPYVTTDIAGTGDPVVCLKRNINNLRRELSPIPDDQLYSLVEEAWLSSNSYPAWCAAVFSSLDALDYQNYLHLRRLIKAAVEVRSIHLEFEIEPPSRPSSPDHAVESERVALCLEKTLAYLGENVLKRFIRKGRLKEAEARHYLTAFAQYINDGLYSPECDHYPEYFRANLPANTHDQYRRNYKHTFETTMNAGKAFLRQCLEIDSTGA